MDVTTERLVKTFLRIRDARSKLAKDYQTEDEGLKSALKQVEIELLRRAQDEGVTGFKTNLGTTYTAEDMSVSIADDTAYFDFIRTTGDLDFFERRVSVKHLKEYMAEHKGETPPGLNLFRELRMRVRAPKSEVVPTTKE
jgi:hypothetical protein